MSRLTKNALKRLCLGYKSLTKHSDSPQTILISTKNIIHDVCTKIRPTAVYTTESNISKINSSYQIPPETPLYIAKSHELEKITGLEGTNIIIEVPKPLETNFMDKNLNKIVFCDQISDPGNMGTLIRSSLAFNFDGLFRVDSCVSIFNDKVIRSSAGASLFLSSASGSYETASDIIVNKNLIMYIASTSPTCDLLLKDVKTTKQGYGILLGNESRGIDLAKWKIPKDRICRVHIPIKNIESLNVTIAGSIIMNHLQNN